MSYENSGELEFAALQADDLLLDALGARRPAGGSGDVVAGLLTAYALKVDTRTGPLTGLLTADEPYDAADYVPMPQPVATMVAPPPIDEPVDLPTHRRSKFLVAHRAAAVVTVGSLVLGLGGVSAAAGGQGSPLDGIRRVMSSVSDQVTPQQSAHRAGLPHSRRRREGTRGRRPAQRARSARRRPAPTSRVRPTRLQYSGLRGDLIELRDRWHRAFDETEADAPAQPGDGKIDVLRPDGKPGLVGGDKGDKGDRMTRRVFPSPTSPRASSRPRTRSRTGPSRSSSRCRTSRSRRCASPPGHRSSTTSSAANKSSGT